MNIGTDVYLSWEGKAEEDRKKQMTGWDIGSGDVGYLRASIGMIKENQVLRLIFPEHWKLTDEERESDGKEYDFKANWVKCQQLGALYITSVLFGIEIKPESEVKIMQEASDNLTQIFADKGYKVACHNEESLPFAVMWLNSLFDFFRLGIKKQEANLSPKIYISW